MRLAVTAMHTDTAPLYDHDCWHTTRPIQGVRYTPHCPPQATRRCDTLPICCPGCPFSRSAGSYWLLRGTVVRRRCSWSALVQGKPGTASLHAPHPKMTVSVKGPIRPAVHPALRFKHEVQIPTAQRHIRARSTIKMKMATMNWYVHDRLDARRSASDHSLLE